LGQVTELKEVKGFYRQGAQSRQIGSRMEDKKGLDLIHVYW
jgi:hypothetical protein